MASQLRHRRNGRGSFFLLLRLVTALALALISLPALNLSAQADELAPEPTPEVTTTEGIDPPPDAEVVVPPPDEEEDAQPPLAVDPAPVTSQLTGSDVEDVPGDGEAMDLRSLAVIGAEPTAEEVCDKVQATFSQNTKEDSTGNWINGDLNAQNSSYSEGDFVPQRLTLSGLSLGSHTVTITYDTIKSDAYAYDYTALWSADGATITSWDDDNPFAPTTPAGAPVGDPDDVITPVATITVTFTATSEDVTLYFAGHIASELDHGPGSGASSVDGSPYHFSVTGLDDCSGFGKRDNQLQAAALIYGALTVVKDASPADSTLFDFAIDPGGLSSTFSLSDDGSNADGGDRVRYNGLPPNTYRVTETDANSQGWSLTGITCSFITIPNGGGAPQATTGSFTPNLSGAYVDVVIVDRTEAICTFTNTQTATVQVDKKWNVNGTVTAHPGPAIIGGSAQLTINGANKDWGAPAHTGYLAGATVSIDETGEAVSNSLCTLTDSRITKANGADVSAQDGALAYSATLQPGANSYELTNFVTCGSTLKLVKVVDNGPALTSDWTLSATPTDGGIAYASGTTGVEHDVTPGKSYELDEDDADVRYVQDGAWTCDNGVRVTDSAIVAPLGKSITCTVHNATAQLTLIKDVINDSGGTAEADDFTLAATPPANAPAGLTAVGGTGSESGTSYWVRPGTAYALSEIGPNGYAQTIECNTGTAGAYVETTTATVQAGGSLTCRFTNDDEAAKLTLEKIVDTSGSGSDVDATDFTLSAVLQGGNLTISGNGDPDSIEGVKEESIPAGTYLLQESGPVGFTPGAWSCGNNTPYVQDVGGQPRTYVDIDLGEDVTCQIVNTALKPTLTLIKVVEGNDTTGGTASASAWTLTATGPETLSGPTGVNKSVLVGTYALSESGGPSGYTPSAWDCGNKTVTNGSITLGLGDNVTCTIRNVAQPSFLTLVKVVNNGNTGATTPASAWTLSATGPSSISGTQGSAGIVNQPVKAGTYTLGESGPSGYTASSWVCNGQTVSGQVTIGLGQSMTCTITNTAQPSTLRLVKNVVNGYTTPASPTNWLLSASGPTSISGAGGTGVMGVQTGTYVLSESGAGAPAGYTAGSWSCTGGFLLGNSVTIGLGQSVVCSITNTAQQPTWSVAKTSDPIDGATVEPGDVITYTVTATKTGGVDPQNVTVQDNLADVLDDATLVAGSISAQTGTATLSGTTLTWSIPVLSGSSTLTYQVRVDDGAYGVSLRNHVTSTGSQNCPPLATVVAAECETFHPTPAWELTKVSDPESGSEVDPGSDITYTLTAVNTSEAVLTGALAEDDLSEVLNNASIDEDSLDESLSLDGTTLTWALPTLLPGEEATVSYTVTVDLETSSVVLENVVVPISGGGVCVETDDCTTTHGTPEILGEEVVVPKPEPRPRPPAVVLPATGTPAGVATMGLLGIGGLLVGAVLMLSDGRRRRMRTEI